MSWPAKARLKPVGEWCGSCRSNFIFGTPNYVAWLSNFDVTVLNDELGRIAWISNEPAGGIPMLRDAEGATDGVSTIMEDIEQYLAVGDVLVIMEVGFTDGEDQLMGRAEVISSTGDRHEISLSDIYAWASRCPTNNPITRCQGAGV